MGREGRKRLSMMAILVGTEEPERPPHLMRESPSGIDRLQH